jgi:hypothetical protein
MRMAITCVECTDTVMVLYQSQLLSSTERPPIRLFDSRSANPDRDAVEKFPVVTLCSYCHAVAWPIGSEEPEWIEPEVYYTRGGPSDVLVSHGMCPGCYDRLMAEVE